MTDDTNSDRIATRSLYSDGMFKAIGAYVFAGGFSYGMKQAGFNVLGQLEMLDCQLGVETARRAFPVRVASVENQREFLHTIKDGVDVLYGNPPCVAYAGTGAHRGTLDERMCHLRSFVYELAMQLQPTVWMWELVPSIWTKDRGWLDAMAFMASRRGYTCYAFLTTSAIHGGFQDRRRFHFVASKVQLNFDQVYADEPQERKGSKTLGDALKIVNGARNEHHDLYNDETTYHGAFTTLFRHTAPGMHLGDLPDSILREHYFPYGTAWTGDGKPGFAHTRGRLDRPCPNILGGHTVVHPEHDRYLTPRECATVMGYPLSHKFSDGSAAYAEIGRGLCTHNAEFLGRVILDGLKRGVSVVPSRVIECHDWRHKARSLSLTLGKEGSRQWYKQRHGVEAPQYYGERCRVMEDSDAI